jgi:O-antigen/teichoic acid export membrane protein
MQLIKMPSVYKRMKKNRIVLQKLKNNSNLRNGMLFTLFSFLNNGFSFVITLIMGIFILPDSYGQLSLFTTMISFLSIFICLGTNGFIGVEYFNSKKEKVCRLINVTIISTFFVYLILILSVFAFSTHLPELMGIKLEFQFYAVSVCLLQILQYILMDVWRLEEKVICYGILTTISVLLNLILTVVFVVGLHWDWEGRAYAHIISCLVLGIASVYILFRKQYLRKNLPSKYEIFESLKFGLPLIPHSMSFWVRQGADRYIINYFITQAVVGLYSFAYNFANIIQMIGNAFNASNSVNIYKILSSDDINKQVRVQKECKLLIYIYILVTILFFLGGYIFIPIIFPKYEASIVFLFPLCIGAMLQCFYLTYVNILFFYKRSKNLMCITFGISLFHFFLSFIVTRYGVIYTSFVIVISNGIIAILVYFYSSRLLTRYSN